MGGFVSHYPLPGTPNGASHNMNGSLLSLDSVVDPFLSVCQYPMLNASMTVNRVRENVAAFDLVVQVDLLI
jgi:hypothetical protein